MGKVQSLRQRLPRLFGGAQSENVARLVTKSEQASRERAADVTSPLFARTKRLPTLEPWQRELVPWAFGAVEYSERYGSMAQEIRLWRLGCLVLLVGLGALNVRQQQTITTLTETVRKSPAAIPWVIEKCNGAVVTAGPATKADEPDVADISTAVAKWIVDLRTVDGDRGKQEALMGNVFAMVAPDTLASQKVKDWYAAHDPLTSTSRRVEVEVFPPKFIGTSRQLKVEWLERETNVVSHTIKESHFSAFVTVAVSLATTLKDRMRNQLGIYVADFSVPSQHK